MSSETLMIEVELLAGLDERLVHHSVLIARMIKGSESDLPACVCLDVSARDLACKVWPLLASFLDRSVFKLARCWCVCVCVWVHCRKDGCWMKRWDGGWWWTVGGGLHFVLRQPRSALCMTAPPPLLFPPMCPPSTT